jgi:hypothetical protein
MVYFVRLTPTEKLQNSKWESPEMNSYWRWRDTIILHKGDTTHSYPKRKKKSATKQDPQSKHSLHASKWTNLHHTTWRQRPSWRILSCSCILLSIINHRKSRKIDKRKHVTFCTLTRLRSWYMRKEGQLL